MRPGLGGQKVVKDGGAVVLPVFHEVIPVNMNTLKLEVMRNKAESLITKDRMRVDIVAAFFVRVIPSEDGIANAAQTLGQRTLHPDALTRTGRGQVRRCAAFDRGDHDDAAAAGPAARSSCRACRARSART